MQRRPQRGEIWRVKLLPEKQGTESNLSRGVAERPCLIVSSDYFNEVSARVTVAPIMRYSSAKREMMSLWGVTLQLIDDVDIDADNDGYPPRERLRVVEVDEAGTPKPYKVIVDCAELYTIFSFDPVEWPELDGSLCDLRWNRRYGALKEAPMFRVDTALEAVIGDGIRYHRKDVFPREGDVVKVTLPEGHHGQCLVVSSTAVHTIRAMTTGLGHCTVVPLLSQQNDDKGDHTVIPVRVSSIQHPETHANSLALCQEIYTLDWRYGTVEGLGGRVHARDMIQVHEALRKYLDLPLGME